MYFEPHQACRRPHTHAPPWAACCCPRPAPLDQQEWLRERGVALDASTVIRQAQVTAIADSNRECAPSSIHVAGR
jgi:hypothetical protein